MSARGTSNSNERGSAEDRRRRKAWLVQTYRADVDIVIDRGEDTWWTVESGSWEIDSDFFEVLPACRCYRCGKPLSVYSVTTDRIVPGCKGGTYRRNNIRPACGHCNSSTGGALGAAAKAGS